MDDFDREILGERIEGLEFRIEALECMINFELPEKYQELLNRLSECFLETAALRAVIIERQDEKIYQLHKRINELEKKNAAPLEITKESPHPEP